MNDDPELLCLRFHLKDKFGDNGLISVIILKPANTDNEKIFHIDTWLMSCRVLGRQVEEASFNIVVEEAKKRGYTTLQGEYMETAKNGMVKDHYKRLGFKSTKTHSIWKLDLANYHCINTHIKTTHL
jgi:FkbH-like protein